MYKVDESKNCARVMTFYDQNGVRVEYPLTDRSVYYGTKDAENIAASLGYDPATITDPKIILKKDDDTIYISEHAMDRLRKRLGFNRSAAYRMTKKAYEKGITKDNIDGYLKTWIEAKTANSCNSGSDYRVYGQYVFIFNKNVLVTVYNMAQKEAYKVAHELHRDKGYNRTRENNKLKKYIHTMQTTAV